MGARSLGNGGEQVPGLGGRAEQTGVWHLLGGSICVKLGEEKQLPEKNKPAFKLVRNDSLLATGGKSQPRGGRRRGEGLSGTCRGPALGERAPAHQLPCDPCLSECTGSVKGKEGPGAGPWAPQSAWLPSHEALVFPSGQ